MFKEEVVGDWETPMLHGLNRDWIVQNDYWLSGSENSVCKRSLLAIRSLFLSQCPHLRKVWLLEGHPACKRTGCWSLAVLAAVAGDPHHSFPSHPSPSSCASFFLPLSSPSPLNPPSLFTADAFPSRSGKSHWETGCRAWPDCPLDAPLVLVYWWWWFDCSFARFRSLTVTADIVAVFKG